MSKECTRLLGLCAKTNTQIDHRYKSEGYIASGAIRCVNGEQIAMQQLPAILRTLLVTDGTVTKLLEAYFWEPIEVVTHSLTSTTLPTPLPWLGACADERVLLRDVQLRGVSSGRNFASAFSVVRLQVFDDARVKALVAGEIGLGVLIRDSGLESYRELLELNAQKSSAKSHAVDDLTDIDVQRTYRIIANGSPAIVISETFPCGNYT